MGQTERIIRDLTDFTGIDLRGAGQIDLTQGNDFSFEIEAEPHILEIITTEINDDGVLEIGFEENIKRINTQEDIIYRITMPLIARLRISGGGTLNCDRIGGKSLVIDLPGGSNVKIVHISVADFALDVRGGAKVRIDTLQAATIDLDMRGGGHVLFGSLEADQMTTDVRGAVNLKASGRVNSQSVSLPGAGNIDFEAVKSRDVTVRLTGVGKVVVHATETLNIRSTGIGSVGYRGTPHVTKKVSGMGAVRALDGKRKRVV